MKDTNSERTPLTLGPADDLATLLGQESGSRRAGELRRRPFDEEPAITPDQGDVRQVSAVCPCSEKVPRPPKFAGIRHSSSLSPSGGGASPQRPTV